MVSSSFSSLAMSQRIRLVVLFCGWVYVVGAVEYFHSWIDICAIALKVSHGGNYPSQYVAVPLKVDGILRTGTRSLGYMDCGLFADDGEQNQRADLCFDSYLSVRLFVRGLKFELW